MRFSVWPAPGRPVSEILDFARYADDNGWFGFWFADHYMSNTGDESFTPGDVHECWSILPAVAAVTSQIRVGPLVSPTSVHHPALLANRAATLDHLTDGRFVLGLGAGWQINEHVAYGIDLEPAGIRVDRFEESITIIRSFLDNDRTTFAGTHYTITDAPCDPKPIQEKLPIIVGTGGPRMCRITATHAQEWNTWGAPAMAGEARDTWNHACDAVGADPASYHTSVQAMVFPTDDEDKAQAIRDGDMGTRSIAGSDAHIVDEFGKLGDLGFDEIIVPDFTLGATHDERIEKYDQLHANVISQLA